MGVHAAFKIQHPDARFTVSCHLAQFSFRFCGFRFLLVLFLLRFVPLFLLMSIHQRRGQFFFHLLILFAEIVDL